VFCGTKFSKQDCLRVNVLTEKGNTCRARHPDMFPLFKFPIQTNMSHTSNADTFSGGTRSGRPAS